MTDFADRYRRLAERFTALVRDVPDGGWSAPSPCQGWTAQDVLDHVIESSRGLLHRCGVDVAASEGDPVARWAAVRDAMQAAIDDPTVAAAGFDGFTGPTTLADTFDGFMSPDLLVHTWDIARATGLEQYEPMPPHEMEHVHRRLASLGDAMRQLGAFGPEVHVAADASAQDRFLGFLGRQA